MRILMVAPYPPRRCGIGAYARARVERLRDEGHEVRVLSPPDGEGDLRVRFDGGRPFALAARVGRRFDRIVVQFQPALYYRPRAPVSKIATSAALLWLCLRRRRTEIVVHEADPPHLWRPDYLLLAVALRAASMLVFHTEREREALERSYRVRVRARIADHTEGVRVHDVPGPAEARGRLGLLPRDRILVAPGFIHPDKGYERAVEAVRGLDGTRLYIVGTVKDPTPRNLRYAERLRSLAAGVPGVELVERYVDEEELDAWIAAADAVVLPYRRSWSSGVLARAQAIGTPAVVTAVGGLPEQASEADVVVHDDRQLAQALAAAAERAGSRRVAR